MRRHSSPRLGLWHSLAVLSLFLFHFDVCLGGGHHNGGGHDDEDHRRLVVFAGPHKTSETSVEEFFYTFAAGRDDMPEDDVLEGWIWPQVPGDNELLMKNGMRPHQAFAHLVLNAENDEIQDELLGIIEHEFKEHAEYGVIIGSEEFDRVGRTPFSKANGITAIARVQDRLGIDDHHVSIILSYKTPRIDQWLAIFNSEYLEMPEGHTDAYEEFVCDSAYTDERWETLHTAMNTLHLAKAYRAQGYRVYVIDMAGVKDAGLDIEHVIGCEILEGDCDEDGWLVGLKGETFEQNSEAFDSYGNRIFKSLSDKQEFDLEHLFRTRDCNYMNLKEDSRLWLLHEKSIFLGCEDVASMELLEALRDDDFMLEAVRSQKDCSNEPMNLRDVLSGDEHVVEEDPDHQGYHDELDSQYRGGASNEKQHHRWYIPFTLFCLVGLAYWYRAEIGDRIDRTHQYGGMPFVIETTRMNRGNERPLSVLT